MGEELVKTGLFYNAEVKFNEVTYPQPATNCVKCHDGSATAVNQTPQGDNWKTRSEPAGLRRLPRRHQLRDGRRHHAADGVDDADGHVGRARKADDQQLRLLLPHATTTLTAYHVTVDPTGANGRGGYPLNTAQDVPTPGYPCGQGPAIPLASQLNLPAGVYKIGLELSKVTVAADARARPRRPRRLPRPEGRRAGHVRKPPAS